MPFISKDWRSPGEQWVKIGPGWERAKVLNYLHSNYFQNGDGDGIKGDEALPPQYNITTRTTKEIRRQNTLSEALLQLDFYSASHDIRRFNYTIRIIQLLLLNMNYLPGNVQRILIKLIEETAAYARENGWKGEIRDVLQAMRESMENQPVWGGQLGSAKLWEEHRSQLQRIINSHSEDEDSSSSGGKAPPMQEFPEEIIRQVLLKLDCDKDIEALANTNLLLSQIADENRIWRELCTHHFTPQQIQQIHEHLLKLKEKQGQGGNNNNGNGRNLMSNWGFNRHRNSSSSSSEEPEDNNNSNATTSSEIQEDSHVYPHWKLKFKTLKRRYGLSKEEYAEQLNLCKSCGLLFWTAAYVSPNHDCGIPILIPVKPGDFIKYFCV